VVVPVATTDSLSHRAWTGPPEHTPLAAVSNVPYRFTPVPGGPDRVDAELEPDPGGMGPGLWIKAGWM
jgi:hypothetical protein